MLLLSTWSLFLCGRCGFRNLLCLWCYFISNESRSIVLLFCLVLDKLIQFWVLSSFFNSKKQYFLLQCVHWILLTLFLLHVSNKLSDIVNKTDKVPDHIEMMRDWQAGKSVVLWGWWMREWQILILKWNASWDLSAKEPTTQVSEKYDWITSPNSNDSIWSINLIN